MLQEQHQQLQLVAALMCGDLLTLLLQKLNGSIKLLQQHGTAQHDRKVQAAALLKCTTNAYIYDATTDKYAVCPAFAACAVRKLCCHMVKTTCWGVFLTDYHTPLLLHP
jgi:hypothetical protein